MHAWEAIQKTLDYIEEHIVEDIKIEILAETASLSLFYYQRLFSRLVKRPVDEFTVLMGIEANIISSDGILDMDDRRLKNMDLVIASFHEKCIPFGDCKTNTKTILKVADNKMLIF